MPSPGSGAPPPLPAPRRVSARPPALLERRRGDREAPARGSGLVRAGRNLATPGEGAGRRRPRQPGEGAACQPARPGGPGGRKFVPARGDEGPAADARTAAPWRTRRPPGGACARAHGCWAAAAGSCPQPKRQRGARAVVPGPGRSVAAAVPGSPWESRSGGGGRRVCPRCQELSVSGNSQCLLRRPALVFSQPGATLGAALVPGPPKPPGRGAGWVEIHLLTCEPVGPAL